MDISINFHNISSGSITHIEYFKKDISSNIYMLKFIKKKYRPFYEMFFNNLIIKDNVNLLRDYKEYNSMILDNLPEFYVYAQTIFLEKHCDINNIKYQNIDVNSYFYISNIYEYTNDMNEYKNEMNENTNDDELNNIQHKEGSDIKYNDRIADVQNLNLETEYIYNIYIFGTLNDRPDINELNKLSERENLIIFIFQVTIDILNWINIICKNRKCNYKIYIFDIIINPFYVLNNLYYGNDINIYIYKIKCILSSKNIIIKIKNYDDIVDYIFKLKDFSQSLNKLKKIHKLYTFYSLNEINVNSKITFNKLFYGIVPYFVIDNKYISKFTNNNNKVYYYKNKYFTKVFNIYEIPNFYTLEL